MLPEAMSKETLGRGELRSQVLQLFVSRLPQLSELLMRRKNAASLAIPGHAAESGPNLQWRALHTSGYRLPRAWFLYCLPPSSIVTGLAT